MLLIGRKCTQTVTLCAYQTRPIFRNYGGGIVKNKSWMFNFHRCSFWFHFRLKVHRELRVRQSRCHNLENYISGIQKSIQHLESGIALKSVGSGIQCEMHNPRVLFCFVCLFFFLRTDKLTFNCNGANCPSGS